MATYVAYRPAGFLEVTLARSLLQKLAMQRLRCHQLLLVTGGRKREDPERCVERSEHVPWIDDGAFFHPGIVRGCKKK